MNKTTFTKDVFEHISERLEDYEGQTLYTSDLPYELTMYENCNGAWIIGTYQASQYIRDNWEEAGDTFEYYKEELDITLNPFEEPEAFVFHMLDYGVSQMLYDLDIMNENDSLTLTPDVMAQIIEEADEVTTISYR